MLDGGQGADRLEGGAGGDRFFFRSAAEAAGDIIVDFTAADGDRIDLRSIDANETLSGKQGFAWMGSAEFSGAAGQLRFADGALQGDLNGDAVADLLVQLAGVTALAPGSVWL
jgi:Ca2+-binding RTX toxin-like protein